jgi:UDP-N-acetylmuramoyl-L-alanyl-D-glutamate--2,6-diaminopimelate ligase
MVRMGNIASGFGNADRDAEVIHVRLSECLDHGKLLQGDPETVITHVVYDSRLAGPGALFVAVPGFHTDGHEYLTQAIDRGAVAVAVERPVTLREGVAVLQVSSSRRALSALAARLYHWPSTKLLVIGVTGTNGKTTTTHLIRSILMEQGYSVGLIGTVHNFIGEHELSASLTTPQASDVQSLMSQMVAAGCTHVVMEVSSEGLDMNRVDDVEFDVGVFSNLTQDHLNYHKTFENYRAAKLSLFHMLGRPGAKREKAAVLNVDDASVSYFQGACQVPVFTYGLEQRAQVSARDIAITSTGNRLILRTPRGEVPLFIRLAGRFNVYNAMAAAATCMTLGVGLPVIRRALEAATGVAGRMESVSAGQSFGVFVDYAHSPDGLENVLRTAQGFARGRVITVFGCGGDRDRTKRPLMGRIAGNLADYTIITSDNPRTEDPAAIVQEIEAGVREVLPVGHFYECVVDRSQAIARAIAIAGPDDVVVIAGKGHETYQTFKHQTIDFDDRAVARTVIEAGLQRKEGA